MKPLPAKRPPFQFRHFPFIKKVFWGWAAATVAIGAIGERFDWWYWMKMPALDSPEGIALRSYRDERQAYKEIYPMHKADFESHTDAMIIAEEHKVIGEFYHVGKDLEKSVEEKKSIEGRITYTKSPNKSVESENEKPLSK